MVRGKMMPSPRPCKPRSNETVFVVFPVSWPEMRVFFGTQIYVPKAENDLDTICWCGWAEKIAEKGASRRPEAYTGGSRNTILRHWFGHEW
jgi:hypothetical protein